MPESRVPVHTGGCQCGAVRYALFAEPTNPHVCHCRMCQKAFGSYFAPLAGASLEDFAWIKGRPGVFRSSEAAERGFCAQCGTPLFFRYVDKERLTLSLGNLDDPSRGSLALHRLDRGPAGKPHGGRRPGRGSRQTEELAAS